MGQAKDPQTGRSGLSLLQVGLQPGQELRKPSPAYADRPQATPTPPAERTSITGLASSHSSGIAIPSSAPSGPASSMIKIASADAAQKQAAERVSVVAGSYVDPSMQHTFSLLRPKDGVAGEAGGSFLAKEIERRESFISSKQPPPRPSSPSTGSNSASNSRQNSVDSTNSPRTLGLTGDVAGGPRGRRGSPAATAAATTAAAGGTKNRPGKARRAVSKGESSDDVMEEWHPFFEADAI
jgi:hypothetical protein